MEDEHLEKLSAELIHKDKWSDFLRRFIDVLRVNIFVVDYKGKIVIPPYRDGDRSRYGSKFLSSTFGFDFSGRDSGFLETFETHGSYLESKDPFDFHAFAIPVKVEEDKVIAYVIVGPVILNKRWDNDDYVNLASQLKITMENLIDEIHEIRVVSHVTVKAILDLLAEVAKDIVELNLEKRKLHQTRFNKEVLPKEIADAAQDLYATIHLDELLVTVLDVAINLTKAECGSIMLLDEERGELSIKVSRGLDQARVRATRLKLGEGVAGIAAKENTSFVISGTEGDQRIKHLLKRPEIKQSVVMPLLSQNRVFGILNLHTKSEENKIRANVSNLKNLSKLISTAIYSL